MKLDELRAKYTSLWQGIDVDPARRHTIEAVCERIVRNRARYDEVQRATGVPWYVVGVLHQRESSGSFQGHASNGDPLDHRTVHVPRGEPTDMGEPPYTWEETAISVYRKVLKRASGLGLSGTWSSVEEVLHFCQAFNGFGYETGAGQQTTPPQRSPYLWSFSNRYVRGKYAADGHFDPGLVDAQPGVAVLLRRLVDMGVISLGGVPPRIAPSLPRTLAKGMQGEDVGLLQKRLKALGYAVGQVDGQFGAVTRAAVVAFQRDAGLQADGIVGPKTWAALWREDGVHPPMTEGDATLRQRVVAIATAEAAKGRSHWPGNEIDRLVLDPLRPIMVELGHLGASQDDTFFNWCAAWVTYICRKAGISVPDRYGDYWASVALVESWRDMGRRTGAWFPVGSRPPRPGDIVCFNWNGDTVMDHIGFVRDVPAGGSTLHTCEGNSDNREVMRSRNLASIGGFLDVDVLAAKL